MGALLVSLAVIGWVIITRNTPHLKHLRGWLLAALALQFSLGVATLLTVVDITLASLHQLGALLLIGLMVRAAYLTPFDRNQRHQEKAL
jgi:heme A synthase